MKKIIFAIVTLLFSMSMNAQVVKVMKIMKGETIVATYSTSNADEVIVEDVPAITGTAKREGGIDVNWVQLWEDGPKFAEYNVGAENDRSEDYGGHYGWGGIQDNARDYNHIADVLTGDNDTATKLWGSNWRMPTFAEFQALLDNCTAEWETKDGVKGRKFTGKGNYRNNSVFFPLAGLYIDGREYVYGLRGYYWSSNGRPSYPSYAQYLYLKPETDQGDVEWDPWRSFGCSVRAVLEEQ